MHGALYCFSILLGSLRSSPTRVTCTFASCLGDTRLYFCFCTTVVPYTLSCGPLVSSPSWGAVVSLPFPFRLINWRLLLRVMPPSPCRFTEAVLSAVLHFLVASNPGDPAHTANRPWSLMLQLENVGEHLRGPHLPSRPFSPPSLTPHSPPPGLGQVILT